MTHPTPNTYIKSTLQSIIKNAINGVLIALVVSAKSPQINLNKSKFKSNRQHQSKFKRQHLSKTKFKLNRLSQRQQSKYNLKYKHNRPSQRQRPQQRTCNH